MKTKLISLLKKELLIIELPENNWLSVFPRLIWICDRETNEYHHVKGSYTLLGKPDEIKEEDVLDLIERVFINYKDYSGKNRAFGSPINSFNSALESKIYWNVNPLGEEPIEPECECEECYEDFEIKYNDFMITQEKTFDRNRTLIFAKQ